MPSATFAYRQKTRATESLLGEVDRRARRVIDPEEQDIASELLQDVDWPQWPVHALPIEQVGGMVADRDV
jgi:hypothetical protein